MRLTDEEHQNISDTIRQSDADAVIYLFGSHAGDTEKGGDIDLLVLSGKINLMTNLEILARLHRRLGERKIDIAVYPDAIRPFARMAMKTGVPL